MIDFLIVASTQTTTIHHVNTLTMKSCLSVFGLWALDIVKDIFFVKTHNCIFGVSENHRLFPNNSSSLIWLYYIEKREWPNWPCTTLTHNVPWFEDVWALLGKNKTFCQNWLELSHYFNHHVNIIRSIFITNPLLYSSRKQTRSSRIWTGWLRF